MLKRWIKSILNRGGEQAAAPEQNRPTVGNFEKQLGLALVELQQFQASLPPPAQKSFRDLLRRCFTLAGGAAKALSNDALGRLHHFFCSLEKLIPNKRSTEYMILMIALADWAARADWHVEGDVWDYYKSSHLRKTLARMMSELAQNLPYEQAQKQSRLRELYLKEIFLGIEDVTLPIGAVNEKTGHSNTTDLLFVSAIARHRRAKSVFEFGTYTGRTTYHLTFASEDVRVTTLTLPPEIDTLHAPELRRYFLGTERERYIQQLYCDSTRLDTTPYRGKMDFIFIDADHSYDGVKSDTRKAFEMLAPGGVIVWHDYAAKCPGVYRFIEEFTQDVALFRVRNTCLVLHVDGVDPMTFEPHSMQPGSHRSARKAAA